MSVVNATGVTKHYDGLPPDDLARRGVDLAVEPGEMLAVMGPSGFGKSTLLHILGGLDTPTSGEVTVLGHRIDKLSETRRARLRRGEIGFVFQFFNLVADLSVRAVVPTQDRCFLRDLRRGGDSRAPMTNPSGPGHLHRWR